MMFDQLKEERSRVGSRGGNGRVIAQNQGCQAAAIHPTTGDLYFSNYQNSLLYRVKKYVIEEFATGKRTTPVRPGTADDAAQTILKVQDKEWEFNIMIHQLVNMLISWSSIAIIFFAQISMGKPLPLLCHCRC